MKRHLLITAALLLTVNCFAQTPQWEWVKLFGDSNGQEARGIAVDKDGNSYVAGGFYGSITFDNVTFTSRGANDIFLVKLDACGKIIWAKQAGGRGYDSALGICIDRFGNSYLTGYVGDTTSFDNHHTVSTNADNVFVAKYDNSGNNVWVKNTTGGNYPSTIGYSISVDSSGNVYFVGNFTGPNLSFASITILNAQFEAGVFIGKYDNNGTLQWVKNTGSIGAGVSTTGIFSIAVDSIGNSYVTGRFDNTIIFGSNVFHAIPSVSGWVSEDIFIAKYDTNGNVIWAKQAGGDGADVGLGICIDRYGNSYITGAFSMTSNFGVDTLTAINDSTEESFIAKYDATGNNVWAKKAFPAGDGGISIDRNNELYTPIAKYTSSGDTVWSKYTSGFNLMNYAAVTDDSLNVYVAGYVQGSSTITLDSFHLTQMGGGDVFIGKLIVNPHNDCGWLAAPTNNLSINNITDEQNKLVTIAPNPFTSQTTITFSEEQKNTIIKITDVLGNTIQQTTINGKQSTINMSGMSKGIYFVQITDEKGNTVNRKIVLE